MANVLTYMLLFILLNVPCSSFAAGNQHGASPAKVLQWDVLEEGLEMTRISTRSSELETVPALDSIRVLKIDPEKFEFRLFSARWEDDKAQSLAQWAERKKLSAAINACMFQKDGVTATGYMREGEKYNNNRIASRYGAFFVSNPRSHGLPKAAVLNRSREDWSSLLPQYETVVQNFRLLDKDGQSLWPENGPAHPISAIAESHSGHILFLQCSAPVSVFNFLRILSRHPELAVKSAMYTEGGKESSLMARKNGTIFIWSGRSPVHYLFSPQREDIAIPNILGAFRKSS